MHVWFSINKFHLLLINDQIDFYYSIFEEMDFTRVKSIIPSESIA